MECVTAQWRYRRFNFAGELLSTLYLLIFIETVIFNVTMKIVPQNSLEAGGTDLVTPGMLSSFENIIVVWYIIDYDLYNHPTGIYVNNTYGIGITWLNFRGDYHSLKRAVVLVKPRQ